MEFYFGVDRESEDVPASQRWGVAALLLDRVLDQNGPKWLNLI